MKQIDFTGTVCRASMREEDLIPAFLSVLDEYWPLRAREIEADYAAEGWPHGSGLDLSEPFNGIQRELAPWLTVELFDALGEIAPDGYYFGASEGDGSDYGFWPVEFLD